MADHDFLRQSSSKAELEEGELNSLQIGNGFAASVQRQFVFECEFHYDDLATTGVWKSEFFSDNETGKEWSVELKRKSVEKKNRGDSPYVRDALHVSLHLHSPRVSSAKLPACVKCHCEIRQDNGKLEGRAEFSCTISNQSPEHIVEPVCGTYSLHDIRKMRVQVETECYEKSLKLRRLLASPNRLYALTAGETKFSADMSHLMRSKGLSDVKIIVKGVKITAHRVILSARSPVFAAMLSHDFREATEGVIPVEDFSTDVVTDFLHFLYTGYILHCNYERAVELLKAAEMYEVIDLKEACGEYLSMNLSVGNAIETLVLADKFRASELRQCAIDYISKNLSVFNDKRQFSDLPNTLLTDILWRMKSSC